MIEYGIFTDEGMIDGPFYSEHEAGQILITYLNSGEMAVVKEICPEHQEQEKNTCEECNSEQ